MRQASLRLAALLLLVRLGGHASAATDEAINSLRGVDADSRRTCDEASWPDKDHGLVCGECKVLVNRFSSLYHTCEGYCQAMGRMCTGAWEELRDTCRVKHEMRCTQSIPSSDAICECKCRDIRGTYNSEVGKWLVVQSGCSVEMVTVDSPSQRYFAGSVKGDKVSAEGPDGSLRGAVLANGDIEFGVDLWTKTGSSAPSAPSPPPRTTTAQPSAPAPAPSTSPPAPAPSTSAPPPAPSTSAPAPAPSTTAPAPAPSTSRTTLRPTTSVKENSCWENSRKDYDLRWTAQGKSFFNGFEFMTHDANNGAAQYLSRSQAEAVGVVQAHDTHAIIGVGSSVGNFKRQSAKIATRGTWKYFLAAARLSKVPHGCGIWPAIWTHAVDVPWPNGGELDLLEYVNDIPSQTSFHTGDPNRCRLDSALVNKPGCPAMPDLNNMNYNCRTDYPDDLGCAPNTLPVWPGSLWSERPSVLAVEWTESFVKIFRIPEAEIPADLTADSPQPDSWDRWLIAYYPFAASEQRSPGSCPNPEDVMAPQQIIFNIGLCGDWASKVWDLSGSCKNRVGPRFPQECRAVDPLKEYDPHNDCCTQFVWDSENKFGAGEYMARQGFFNISWVKVYQ